MATTTGTFNFYDALKKNIANGAIDIDTDTLTVLLCTNSYVPDSASHEFVNNVTNEIVGNGYARMDLINRQWVVSGGADGQMKLDSNDPVFSAVGGSIVARYWVLTDTQTGNDATSPLISWGLIDDAVADVTVTNGNNLTLTVNASGWFTLG